MPLSPSETTKLLESLNHRPKKKLGQNFLVDGNIVGKSISMADLPQGMPVVEIGPGLGTLTKQLLERNHPVFAVEIDESLFLNLQNTFSKFIESNQLNILKGDAVKKPLANLPIDTKDFAVVANLPYAISSAWMEAILNTGQIPLRMVLMLQREAVDRMNAGHCTKEYNALTIFLKAAFKLTHSHTVPRQCFFPIPGIDSALVKMDRLQNPFLFPKKDRILIRQIFTQRRKQIGSLANKAEQQNKNKINQWIEKLNLARNLRPEQIEPTEWQKLVEIQP